MASRQITKPFVLFVAITIFTVAAAQAADKPNIVLVMADDQGWGDMAYNGHPTVKTPNFDAAAAEGLRFDRFYAAAPVCSPTRASVLTGRHPNRMGVFKWGYPIRPQESTLPEALKSVGYTTAHFGKWHLGSVRNNSPAHPGINGFDYWLSAPNFYDNDPILSDRGKAVPLEGESSIVTADAALEWIAKHAKTEEPFFAVVWFGSPHNPHQAIEEDRALYKDKPKKVQDFYGEITGMDRAFGKIRNQLAELGIRDNTILWYCSDNGALPKVGSTGDHRGHKGKIYEGGLLVPAILEWPAKITVPVKTQLRCNTCDIYPTLLNLVGANVEQQPVLDGIDLTPLLKEFENERTKPMGFWDYPIRGIRTPSAEWMGELLEAQNQGNDLEPDESSLQAGNLPSPAFPDNQFPGHAAWIDGDWKLHRIAKENEDVRWELYNLASDQGEQNDLKADQAERVTKMQSALENWLKSVVKSLNGEDYSKS